jgi:RND family efflux transporter MFP subunit
MNYETPIQQTEDESVAVDYDSLTQAEEEERQSRRKLWIIGAVMLVLLIAIGLWLARTGGAGDGEKKPDLAPVVTVVAPGRTTIEGQISANGTLAARREMPVGSVGEGGQVVAVLVEPGDWVGQGQVLAVVDRQVQVQQQASSSAQIGVAEADARLAQSNLDRALKLVEKGFISKADIDRLTATRDAANARVRVARAQYGELQARTARLNIVAPAAGLLLERRVEPGQVVGGGSGVLFRLAKGGEMELKALLSETELAQLSNGIPALVTPTGSTKQFQGQVWQVSPVIDPQTRQGAARIALAYAPELRPGGFASASIKAGTLVAPVLPESAILSDGKSSYVYIVGADNKAMRRDVKTGSIVANGIVVSEGLTGSERVVLRAGGFLQPGETVKPVSPKS